MHTVMFKIRDKTSLPQPHSHIEGHTVILHNFFLNIYLFLERGRKPMGEHGERSEGERESSECGAQHRVRSHEPEIMT